MENLTKRQRREKEEFIKSFADLSMKHFKSLTEEEQLKRIKSAMKFVKSFPYKETSRWKI